MMNAHRPFIRQAELTVWPQRESEATGQGERIIADGSLQRLRVKFDLYRSIFSASTGQISIYNLSQAGRERLQKSGQKVSLRVGWQRSDSGLQTYEIFSGGLMSAVHSRHGSDIITKLTLLTGVEGMLESAISKTYAEGVSLISVLKDLASNIKANWDDSRVSSSLVDIKLGHKGYSFAGRTKEWLDKLAAEYGFSWSIQSGVFQALTDKESLAQSGVVLSSQAGTLIRATPILSGPAQIQTGVDVLALIVPGIQPGDRYFLTSAINPNLTNLSTGYTAHSISYSGDTGGQQWEMCIQSFIDMVSNV